MSIQLDHTFTGDQAMRPMTFKELQQLFVWIEHQKESPMLFWPGKYIRPTIDTRFMTCHYIEFDAWGCKTHCFDYRNDYTKHGLEVPTNGTKISFFEYVKIRLLEELERSMKGH